MPTALDVDVAADDAITPPNVMKKKEKNNESEGNKITPAATAEKCKPAAVKKAQPSIMAFFKQPSSKNLFSKNAKSSKDSSTTKKAPTESSNDNAEAATATKPAAASKLAQKSTKPSSVPTEEEIREIVMGSSTKLADIVVPEPVDVPSEAEDKDSLLPKVPIGSSKKKDPENAAAAKKPEPQSKTAAPEEKESAVEPETEPLKEKETAPTEDSGAANVNDAETLGSHDDGEEQSDEDTVDMSPLKQTIADMANDTKVPEEVAVNPEDSTEEKPVEAATSSNDESGSNADVSTDCVDLTAEGASPAPEKPKPDSSKTEKLAAVEKPPAKPSPLKPPAAPAGVSSERQAALAKNATLRAQYQSRLDGLVKRGREGLVDENFQLPALAQVEALPEEGTTVSSPLDFPECAIRSLALLVQESRLTLTDLVATSLVQLKEAFPDAVEFHAEGVAAKIKLLAAREPYVQPSNDRVVNKFEDDNLDRMWRWEIVSLDLLPDECVSKIKKARTSRKKLRSHSKALCTLLKYLDQADKLLLDPNSSQIKCDDVSAKISSAEEKVLKYEREDEKVRLAAEAKKKKEAAKAKEQDGKKKGKALAAEQKKKEKALAAEQKKKEKALAAEQKKKEKELKKQEREDKKRKKEEEKQKEQQEKERKVKKQRTMMESFFSRPSSSAKKTKVNEPEDEEKPAAPSSPSVDSDSFFSRLNASDQHVGGPMFPSLSSNAVASRKRRTRIVPVQVFATIMPPENAFDKQPYAELQTIRVPNKYKFLSFGEDCRPPYHGTWSKSSSLVTGRSPINKDTAYLDYDVDSEAEWEEGDDELGEDCEADGPDEDDNMDDEEGDTRMYNYQDGWLAADDDLGIDDDDVDEDTKLLRKKKLQKSSSHQKALADQATVCIIAPGKGGVPSDDVVDDLDQETERIEGVNPSDALDLLMSHTGIVLGSEYPCLDAFPPPLIEEGNLDASSPNKGSGGAKTSSSNEMSRSDLIAFIEFVHHSKFPSKDKLVEELRTVHKTITSSRAQATRKLDSIAEKKRYPGGVYWEVRRELLEELGLEELLNKQFELPPPKPASEKKAPKKPKAPPSSDAKGATPASAEASKTKASPKSTGNTKSATPEKTKTSNEKSSSKKKRPAPPSEASVKLFAGFVQKKKAKTKEE